MSIATEQKQSYQFILCQLDRQTFVLDTNEVVSAHGDGHIQPVREGLPAGACGWVKYGQEQLPAFDLAEGLGVTLDAADEREHIVICNIPDERVVLRVRQVSRTYSLPAERRFPLPGILKRYVGNRYEGIVHFQEEHGKLSDEDIAFGVTQDAEIRDEMMLIVDPGFVLDFERDAIAVDPGMDEIGGLEAELFDDLFSGSGSGHSEAGKKAVSSGTQREMHQLLLFAPTTDRPNDRNCMFGLSVSQVMEVCNPLPMIPVPGVPDFIEGIVNWRDQPVPVVKIAERLGMNSIDTEIAPRLLVVQIPGTNELIAFHTLSTVRSLRLPIPSIPSALPHMEKTPLVYGCFELEDSTLVLPDLSAIAGGSSR